jgi:hypothetical protein
MARVALLFLLAAAARAQSIDGRLTDSVSHAPIPDVIVTILGPARYNGTTDDTGVFHIGPVQPGKYVWNIVKAGYVLPPERRKAFQIDTETRLSVEMDPLPTLEGRVRYPDGRPAPRAPVWLAPAQPMTGAVRASAADPGGRFFFDDVKPGDYVLRAAAAPGDPKAEGELWAATWFPSVLEHAGAETIRVGAVVTSTYDIRLRSVPARRIRGVVRDEVGRPAAGVTVTLGSRDPGEQQTAHTGEDGAFDFTTRDGEWHLSATLDIRKAAAQVAVSRHDVENVQLRLVAPFALEVVTEGADPRFGTPSVFFLPVDGPGTISTNAKEIYPGTYRIQVMPVTPGRYLESVKLGDADAMGKPVTIWDAALPVRIKYSDGGARISGSVEDGAGATVLIVPVDETLARMIGTTVDPQGRFDVRSLRPGDYYVLAFAANEPRLSNRDVLRTLFPAATKVHLEKGEVLTIPYVKLLSPP